MSKADELEKEEKAYLDELAVLNRRGDTSKDDMFDFAVDSEKKRKEPINGELDEMKQMKKKRKKDKRKDETPEERYVDMKPTMSRCSNFFQRIHRLQSCKKGCQETAKGRP